MLQTDKSPNRRIQCERVMIPSDTDGVTLQLINKRPADAVEYSAERTLVMIHGATFPSESLFDVPVAGASFMDVLARHGYDVWAVDVRGYGGSTRPPEMSQSPEDNPPLSPARTAVRDLATAVNFVREKRGVERVNLLGMSWGATAVGALAAEAGDRFGRLILVTPLWLSGRPLRFDAGGPIGAYRIVNPQAFEAAWRGAAPEQKRASLIPEGWFDAWVEVTLATDLASPTAGTIRAPSGAVLDVRQHWTAGNPLYDPSAITNPVLLVCAEWDVDVRFDMAQDLFTRLTDARYKRLVEIGQATHMVLMEKNRGQAFDAVIRFLDEQAEPAA